MPKAVPEPAESSKEFRNYEVIAAMQVVDQAGKPA